MVRTTSPPTQIIRKSKKGISGLLSRFLRIGYGFTLPEFGIFRGRTSELAGNIKYNQEERDGDGDGDAFSPLHDYLKLAEGAHAGEIAKLTKA